MRSFNQFNDAYYVVKGHLLASRVFVLPTNTAVVCVTCVMSSLTTLSGPK